MSIKSLDPGTVHRICSGQVIINLANAVKELIENSLDAGAKTIEVRLRHYGSESIEVIDDGPGIDEADYQTITLKHYTSKIAQYDDLESLGTFGFRGEALSSLCALSNLTITTRCAHVERACRLEYDKNGLIRSRTACARSPGTTVLLEKLFHTLPVRHKEFLRNLKREYHKLMHVLQCYCLVSDGVKLTCTHVVAEQQRSSTLMATRSRNSLRENIIEIFGVACVNCLCRFEQTEPDDEVLAEYKLKAAAAPASTATSAITIADAEAASGDHSASENKQQQTGQNKPMITAAAVSAAATAGLYLPLFKIDGYVSSCEHGQGRSAPDRQYMYVNRRPCDHARITKVINEVYHQYNRTQYPMFVLNIHTDSHHVDVNVTPDKLQMFIKGERSLLALLKASLLAMYAAASKHLSVSNSSFNNSLRATPRMSSFAKSLNNKNSSNNTENAGWHQQKLTDLSGDSQLSATFADDDASASASNNWRTSTRNEAIVTNAAKRPKSSGSDSSTAYASGGDDEDGNEDEPTSHRDAQRKGDNCGGAVAKKKRLASKSDNEENDGNKETQDDIRSRKQVTRLEHFLTNSSDRDPTTSPPGRRVVQTTSDNSPVRHVAATSDKTREAAAVASAENNGNPFSVKDKMSFFQSHIGTTVSLLNPTGSKLAACALEISTPAASSSSSLNRLRRDNANDTDNENADDADADGNSNTTINDSVADRIDLHMCNRASAAFDTPPTVSVRNGSKLHDNLRSLGVFQSQTDHDLSAYGGGDDDSSMHQTVACAGKAQVTAGLFGLTDSSNKAGDHQATIKTAVQPKRSNNNNEPLKGVAVREKEKENNVRVRQTSCCQNENDDNEMIDEVTCTQIIDQLMSEKRQQLLERIGVPTAKKAAESTSHSLPQDDNDADTANDTDDDNEHDGNMGEDNIQSTGKALAHMKKRRTTVLAYSMSELKRRHALLCERHTLQMDESQRQERERALFQTLRFRGGAANVESKEAERELDRCITKEDFLRMRICGQFNRGFIVAQLDEDLFIIDQHAADEIYNFETLQRGDAGCMQKQRLLQPKYLELPASSESILIDNVALVERVGYELQVCANRRVGNRVMVTCVPMSKQSSKLFDVRDIDELLFVLSESELNAGSISLSSAEQSAATDVCASSLRALYASKACRKSVMIGDALNMSEMRRIVTHLHEIDKPWNCPHGRPTMRHLINLDVLRKSNESWNS